ncbi:alpha-L-arabinofuranosidase C-terminal domain-containing protein [Prolixibacter sp. NT017]|uniref:alpha-L-arabinofuranosidase C-terminal domain-containing protein n=1 Tax=Prolixibacter sp. NT017 TaxID=2652390 RepID=UPI001271BCFC|nr:alpha-L-arabinofuranosidase C-terminal domain-containing protein [Prolixibacter sp. NT017]GET24025.1 intracellular exo-alpha-(1->5)-L-arabinofuranosidase 1 [Prolixibacter sp. NT017]
MKKVFTLLGLALPLFLSAQTAKIRIDVDRTIGKIDPNIYGVFMEPIHFNGARMGLPDTVSFNTLYGNLYDPSSPLADKDGFRKDYIDAAKELKVTNMRWPGGNYVMAYNWEDGIGPKSQRPVRVNMAWGGTDNNHVGTDEWVELNKSIGSDNVVCVNLGLGDIQNACHWLEYCNYPKGTYYSDLRIKYGHKEPYNIKIWDLGNEVDGAPWELGHKTADDYVKTAREAAKAMKSIDPTIRFVASGSSYYESTGKWIDWNRKVLEGLGDKINYLSIHRYWEKSPDYYTYMGQSAMDFDEKIRITADEIQTAKAKKDFTNPIYVSVDEYGAFGSNFRSVLSVAQCLNSFVRHADVVKMANFTMFTSLLGSDREKGTYKTPLFYIFKSFSNNCLGNSVDTYVACDTFNTEKYKGIPYLDVTSVYSPETQTLYINVINRNKDKAITADILPTSGEMTGKAVAGIIDSQSLETPFSFDKQSQYIPVTKEIKTNKTGLTYSFLPHSFTQIKVEIKK